MAKNDVIQHYRTSVPGRKPTAGDLALGEWYFNVADGIVFFKDDSGNVREVRGVQEKSFTVTIAGQTNFPVLASASKVLSFVINQLDYAEFVSITPAGSGMIVYNPTAGGYALEVGDFVKVLYF